MRMVVKRKRNRFQVKFKSASDVGTLGDGRASEESYRGHSGELRRGGWTLVSFAAVNMGRMGQLSFSLTLEVGSMSQQ